MRRFLTKRQREGHVLAVNARRGQVDAEIARRNRAQRELVAANRQYKIGERQVLELCSQLETDDQVRVAFNAWITAWNETGCDLEQSLRIVREAVS